MTIIKIATRRCVSKRMTDELFAHRCRRMTNETRAAQLQKAIKSMIAVVQGKCVEAAERGESSCDVPVPADLEKLGEEGISKVVETLKKTMGLKVFLDRSQCPQSNCELQAWKRVVLNIGW